MPRTNDPTLYVQKMLGAAHGNPFVQGQQFVGAYSGIVHDNSLTNSKNPIGYVRIRIPELTGGNVWDNSLAFPGDVNSPPPPGTHCNVVFTHLSEPVITGFFGWSSSIKRIPQTYSVSGTLGAWISGPVNYLPPFYMPVLSDEQCNLVGVRASVHSGSVSIDTWYQGSAMTGTDLVGMSVGTTATTTMLTTPLPVNDGDSFQPVITAISGTPDGLAFTFYFDILS